MNPVNELRLEADDRLLILAPHPDDETIATGGVIQKAVALGLPVRATRQIRAADGTAAARRGRRCFSATSMRAS